MPVLVTPVKFQILPHNILQHFPFLKTCYVLYLNSDCLDFLWEDLLLATTLQCFLNMVFYAYSYH